jgi:hypothetical protein
MKLRVAAIATLLLAGCGQSGQQAGTNGAGNDQSASAQATGATGGSGGITIQPGEWEITMEMQAAQVSGLPAGMQMPHIPPTTTRSCVTPEQVSRANTAFLGGASTHPGIDCDYSHVTIAGGRIQGTSTCSRAGMQVSVTMDGSFTPTSYDVHQQMHSTMRGRTSESTNHLVGRRVGECTAADAQEAAQRDGARAGK